MRKHLLCSLILISYYGAAWGQEASLKTYLEKETQIYKLENLRIDFGTKRILKDNLVFFGFVHGSATPQKVDLELLKYFVAQGTRYYAPEVGHSQAFFLNRYLETGKEEFLHFVTYYQALRTPQDASIQWIEKWKQIYVFNQSLPQDKKIKIIGTDRSLARSAPSLLLTHLAYLAPAEKTGLPIIDSLSLYRNLDILDLKIYSGKPVWELVRATRKSTYDYVYPLQSKYHFGKRFLAYFEKNQSQVVEAFGKHHKELKEFLSKDKSKRREEVIFDNFQRRILPLIRSGEKVYANFGYAHIHQGPINGKLYLAGMLKEKYPELKISSILGVLAKSNALKERKLCKSGENLVERGITFEKAEYCGYKTAKSYDGDSFFERLAGIQALKKVTGKKDILMLDLHQPSSPLYKSQSFIYFTKGGKNWNIDPSLTTTDYVQYLIYMQHSEATIPFEEYP